MDLTALLVLSTGIWAVLSFLILPAWKSSLKRYSPFQRVRKVALETIAEQVRDLAGICSLTISLLLIGLWTIQITGRSAPEFLHGLSPAIVSIQEALTSFGELWKLWLFATLTGALLLVWNWSARKDAAAYIREHISSEIERLNQMRQQDPEEWARLEPTDEMNGLDATFHDAMAAYAELGDPRDGESEETKARRAELASFIEQVSNARALLDYQRRIDLSTLDTQPSMPDPPRWYHYALRTFFSSGARRDARAFSKGLAFATVAFTILGMVGLQSEPLTAGLNKTINQLAVQHSKAEADKSWEQATGQGNATPEPPQPAPDSPWTSEDDQLAHHLARYFVRAVSQSRAFPVARIQPGLANASRAHSVRSAILSEAASPSTAAAEAASENLTRLENELLARPASAAGNLDSKLESEFARRVRTEAQAKPRAWRAIRVRVAEHFSAYSNLPSMGDLHSQLVKETIGAALDVAPLDVTTESGKFAKKILSDMAQDTIDDLLRAELRRTLVDMVHGDSLDEALAKVRASSRKTGVQLRVRTAVEHDLSAQLREDALRMELRHRTPSLAQTADSPEFRTVQANSSEVLRMAGDHPVRNRLEALASYDDYFPGQFRAEEKTALGRLESLTPSVPNEGPHIGGSGGGGSGGGGGGGLGGGGGRPAASGAARSGGFRTRFLRARSFGMARGFARVGGVLIGREPDNLGKLQAPVRDINWTIAGDQFELSLTATSGVQRLGSFPGSTVHRALNYAADGRVTTVTMVTAEPLQELKILLHPALVDTPIGCRAIELDRLVDTHARRDPQVSGVEARIQAEYTLYALAWYLRMAVLLDGIGGEASTGPMAEGARNAVRNLSLRAAMLKAFENGFPQSAAQSLLSSRSAYFDGDLIKQIKNARVRTEDLGDWLKTLASEFRESSKALAERGDQAQARQWVGPATAMEVWSGVREAAYSLTPDLAFLRASNSRSSPFEFVLQVSFPDSPQFGEASPDNAPFEFTWVQPLIQSLVESGIRSAGRTAEILEPSRQFALLQRLFRVALDGGFPQLFPLEKLAALSRASAPFDRHARTMRWNVRPDSVARLSPEAQRLRAVLNVAADEQLAHGCPVEP